MARVDIKPKDWVVLDGTRYEAGESDATGILLLPLRAGGVRQIVSHQEVKDAYFSGRLTIERQDLLRLPPEIRRNIEKPIEAFDDRDRAEASKRLEYVLACERNFSQGTYSQTKAGYTAIAKLVAEERDARARELELALDKPIGWSTLRDGSGAGKNPVGTSAPSFLVTTPKEKAGSNSIQRWSRLSRRRSGRNT